MMRLVTTAVIALSPQEAPQVLQSVEGEISSFAKAFARLTRYRFTVEVNHFTDTEATSPDYQHLVTVARLGGAVLYKRSSLTMFSSGRHTVLVDEDRKRITYNAGRDDKSPPQYSPDEVTRALVKLGERGYSFRRLGREGNDVHLVAESKTDVIRRADIFLNAGTHLLTRIEYVYRPENGMAPGRVTIHYRWSNPGALNPSDFRLSTYVLVRGDDIRPSKPYESFELIRLDGP